MRTFLDDWLINAEIARSYLRECNELIQVASNKDKITLDHLLPEMASDPSGHPSIRRPKEYDPVLVGHL